MQYFTADAFTDTVFCGGQAVTIKLDEWLPDKLMQNIAAEFNVSETSFVIKRCGCYDLRWFTPAAEIDLCGHATLAAAFVLFSRFEKEASEIVFHTLGGELTVKKRGDLYEMDFPAIQVRPCEITKDLIAALGGAVPAEAYKSRDYVFVFDTEAAVRAVRPDYEKMKQLPGALGVFISAPGENSDIVARAFWPKMGIHEDPACGSMHCNLTPLWAKKLGKKKILSHQLSPRGAVIYAEDAGERVKLSGHAVLSCIGDMELGER